MGSINFIEWDNEHQQYLIRLVGEVESQEKRLNLIKASEEMYEALKELVAIFDSPNGRVSFIEHDKAAMALAKADGINIIK